ncbi:hypothetical protein K439DRAFT_1637830, partial [Ramaria rubella]
GVVTKTWRSTLVASSSLEASGYEGLGGGALDSNQQGSESFQSPDELANTFISLNTYTTPYYQTEVASTKHAMTEYAMYTPLSSVVDALYVDLLLDAAVSLLAVHTAPALGCIPAMQADSTVAEMYPRQARDNNAEESSA